MKSVDEQDGARTVRKPGGAPPAQTGCWVVSDTRLFSQLLLKPGLVHDGSEGLAVIPQVQSLFRSAFHALSPNLKGLSFNLG